MRAAAGAELREVDLVHARHAELVDAGGMRHSREHSASGCGHPTVDDALETAARDGAHAVARMLRALGPSLTWAQNPNYRRRPPDPKFLDNYGYAVIAGPPDGPPTLVAEHPLALGVLLLGPRAPRSITPRRCLTRSAPVPQRSWPSISGAVISRPLRGSRGGANGAAPHPERCPRVHVVKTL